MKQFPFLSRDYLLQRHRLSHQQIDNLLNENRAKEHLAEKYHQMFQVSEFIKLSDEFRKAAVPFIPLKGPMLSYRLHKDPSYRYSNDLDFLVPKKAVKNAIFTLEKNGYLPCFFSWPDNPTKERIFIRLSNQLLFIHPEKQINVEIHWKLFKPEITNPDILSKVLSSNKDQIEFNDRKFEVFSNELELLYLIIHGGLHAWVRLKWLIDIKDFIEMVPFDAEKFQQLVLQLNACRMVSLCNTTLEKYFPDCSLLPWEFVRNTTKRGNFAIAQIEDKNYYDKPFLKEIRMDWFRLNSFRGFRYKLSLISVIFFDKYLNFIVQIKRFTKP